VHESVVSLKLVDGRGRIHQCFPGDDLFKAAIGGVGAVGIIIEVVVQGVDRFNVRQKVEISTLNDVERNLDRRLAENEHLSIYAFPFTNTCQVNTWNRVEEPQSKLGAVREQINISLDALTSAWVANLLAYSRLLRRFSRILHRLKWGTDLVLESSQAFNRTMYPLHQELEFAIPYEQTFPVLRAYLNLYENLQPHGLPYGAVEVRFTPAGRDSSLIGPGRERQSAWIDVLHNDSRGEELFFSLSEALMMALGGRPHLGKWNKRVNRRYLAHVQGQNFARFRELVKEHDPAGKFVNEYTRRLFEPDAES
jgi:FAD/FMN-containing dehydrogenase